MAKWKSKANWKDPNWVYVNAASTDITKTFDRIRREMEALKPTEKIEKVTPIRKTK